VWVDDFNYQIQCGRHKDRPAYSLSVLFFHFLILG